MRVPHVVRATGLCLAFALTPGVADAATAKTNAPAKTQAKAKRPEGGVKLTIRTRQKIGTLTCGRVKGVWLPGSTVSGWFVTYQQQSVTALKASRKAKGARRRALKRTVTLRKRQAEQLYAWCAPFNTRPAGQGGPSTGTSNPGTYVPGYDPGTSTPAPYYGPYQQPGLAPVRVDVAGAVGLALRSAQSQAPTTGSNLSALAPTGAVRDAVVSGAATVSRFLIAPDGSVYVLFASPVMLDVNAPNALCVLARVVPGVAAPVCIDPEVYGVQWWEDSNYGGVRNPAVQFDAAGGIYYLGYGSTGGTVLRRHRAGVTTNLITENAYINDFLVLPDGRVLLSGSTMNTQAQWLRQLSPERVLSTLRSSQSTFMRRFPDGNVYIGVSDSRMSGVVRYSSETSSIEPTAWIGRSDWYGGGPVSHNDLGPICNSYDYGARVQAVCNSNGSYISRVFEMADDRVFVLAGGSPGMHLAEYFPSLSIPDTAITAATAGASNGRDVVLSGLDPQGRNILGTHDTTTGTDRQLIGADREIEVYHLDFTADGRTVLFDGLRFADNTYIVGQVDLATGAITAAAPTGGKLAGLQAFR